MVVPRTSACGSCHAAKASSGIPRRARDLAWSAITVLTARPGVCSVPPRRRACFFFIVKTSRVELKVEHSEDEKTHSPRVRATCGHTCRRDVARREIARSGRRGPRASPLPVSLPPVSGNAPGTSFHARGRKSPVTPSRPLWFFVRQERINTTYS